jgi:uncharacterized protein YbbC (DUF1343 family)
MKQGDADVRRSTLLVIFHYIFIVGGVVTNLCAVDTGVLPSPVALQDHNNFMLGVENLTTTFLKSLTPRGDLSYGVGLVTNQTGKNQHGVRTLDILLNKGLRVVALFAPEHGAQGTVFMERDIADTTDTHTNIKVLSLYKNGRTQKLTADMVKDIDVLFFDMQDCGMRHYTYITTLFEMLEAAADFGKIAVVLDRPNLLGGIIEGPLVDPGLKSAISYAPIPLRYGMTVGELALYFNQKLLVKPVQLHIVPMKNYSRYGHSIHGLLTYLSPNIASIPACYGYSFLGLLGEVTPYNVGVGTDKAFQCILLPDSLQFPRASWHELQVILKLQGVESSFYTAQSMSKKVPCSGLRISITDINQFSAFNTLLRVLEFFKRGNKALNFKTPAFDKAIGTSRIRAMLDGSLDPAQVYAQINKDLDQFFSTAMQMHCFLYEPYPHVIHVT